jgi:hypothetical protein
MLSPVCILWRKSFLSGKNIFAAAAAALWGKRHAAVVTSPAVRNLLLLILQGDVDLLRFFPAVITHYLLEIVIQLHGVLLSFGKKPAVDASIIKDHTCIRQFSPHRPETSKREKEGRDCAKKASFPDSCPPQTGLSPSG